MAGGLAGLLVAANPEHVGGAPVHAFWAAAGFAALVAWPGGAWRRGPSVPWGLRPAVSAVAAGLMLGLLTWFGAELVAGGGQIGLAERVMGVAQAGWPLVVVLSCRLTRKLGPVGRADPDRCGGKAGAVAGLSGGWPGGQVGRPWTGKTPAQRLHRCRPPSAQLAGGAR